MTLQEALLDVKDPRSKVGLRTTLEQMFCMIILSNLCGYFGGRPIARFLAAHSSFLTTHLNLKHD